MKFHLLAVLLATCSIAAAQKPAAEQPPKKAVLVKPSKKPTVDEISEIAPQKAKVVAEPASESPKPAPAPAKVTPPPAKAPEPTTKAPEPTTKTPQPAEMEKEKAPLPAKEAKPAADKPAADDEDLEKPLPPEKLPEVEAAIPPAVKALGEPLMMEFPGGIHMAVTAATDKAQAHVNQGLNHLHGGWEFEASRHFAAAMREDPECLLAHWGMVMSLLSPSPETGPARNAATDRFLHLVDGRKGTELELGYAYGLIKYIEDGPAGASVAFRKVADQFPNDMQAGIFAALFGRSGYDELGSAKPDQEAAEKSLEEMITKNPRSPLPLNALLTIRAEAPDLKPSLDLALKLVQLAPEYPPYFHVAGHYQWRSGEHAKAATAFGRAASFYERWMKDNKVGVADCPEWVKAECYRVVALASKGDFETAYAAARQVAATPLPPKRLASPGARLLLWDAKTLPARVLLHRGLRGNANEALHSLPTPDEMKNTRDSSLAYWWVDGLRFALEARRLLDEEKVGEAQQVIAAFTRHGEKMVETQPAANALGERSPWNRAFRGIEVLASDLRGRLAMLAPPAQRGPAYNWFASAMDRQRIAPMMFPPMVLTPMGIRLGEYYLATDKPQDALEIYERTLAAFPNDIQVMTGLQNTFTKDKQPEKAAEIGARIKAMQAE